MMMLLRLSIKLEKDLWKNIKNKLNDLKEGEDITIDQLLKDLDISDNEYIVAHLPINVSKKKSK